MLCSAYTAHFRIFCRSFRLLLIKYKDVKPEASEFQGAQAMHDDDNADTVSTTESQDGDQFPEEPTTCCMSGCANCVWLDYVDKLSEYFKDGGEQAIKEIEERVQDPNMKAFLMSELRMRGKLKKE